MRFISPTRSAESTASERTEPSASRTLAFRIALEPLLGRLHAADADGAAELLHVGDAPAGEGVDDQPPVVERRHLERVGVEALDAAS